MVPAIVKILGWSVSCSFTTSYNVPRSSALYIHLCGFERSLGVSRNIIFQIPDIKDKRLKEEMGELKCSHHLG
jgi:hypothetical protein